MTATKKETNEFAEMQKEFINSLAEQLQVCIELSALIERAADEKQKARLHNGVLTISRWITAQLSFVSETPNNL